MRTLHAYFARETLKTFSMTSMALTILLVMGGGVANLFRGEGVSAVEMARIFVFLAPVAFTLILPVAALFSVAITYGRAAVDNEVLACRAAGINIHRILLAPFTLGLLVTVFTYFSWNYMIPFLTRSIEDITRRDLPAIVMGQFLKARPLSYGKYRIMANTCEAITREQLPDDIPSDFLEKHTLLRLVGVSFVEIEDQEPARFGTADETIIDFDNSGTTPRVTVDLQGGRSFDAIRRQYYEFEHQVLGPIEIPLPIKRKIKFETLDRLREFRADPRKIPEVQDLLHGMRRAMKAFFLCQDVEDHMDSGLGGSGVYRLKGDSFELEISGDQYLIDIDESRAKLRGVRARLTAPDEPARIYHADEATIELRSGRKPNSHVILVELLGNVRIGRDPPGPTDRVVNKPKESLPQVNFADQQKLFANYEAFDIGSLFSANAILSLYPKQKKMQAKLLDRLDRYASEVRGEIHFRASYSLCAIAIVLIGALLGIIIRGGQVLTAFGISCVPMLFVIVASIVGRNLADRPSYGLASICVMWGATAVMYAATFIVGTKVLKR